MVDKAAYHIGIFDIIRKHASKFSLDATTLPYDCDLEEWMSSSKY